MTIILLLERNDACPLVMHTPTLKQLHLSDYNHDTTAGKSLKSYLASYPDTSVQEDEEKEPDTDCMHMRWGTPEICGVIGYYRILSVYDRYMATRPVAVETPVAYARAVCTRPFLLLFKGLGSNYSPIGHYCHISNYSPISRYCHISNYSPISRYCQLQSHQSPLSHQ